MSSRPEPAVRPRTLDELLDHAPAPLILPDARATIAEENRSRRTRIVVLDDDPTGTQTVSGVPVVIEPGDEDLRWALEHPSGTAFVLTNSRARSSADAQALGADLGRRLAGLASELEVDLRCISRSDSTLRGHFPAETDALADGLRSGGKSAADGVLLCPCFLEAGRVTVDDVHWVRDHDGRYVPAARTEFARDLTFGYVSEDLPAWVRERYGDRSIDVRSVSLADIRRGGPERVAEILDAAPRGAVVIGNAAHDADLEVLVLGLQEAERRGRRMLYRTAPSFVGVRGGLPRRPPSAGIASGDRGLVVVGSHTSLTTRQLDHAIEAHGLSVVELPVAEILGDGGDRCVERSADVVARGLRSGHVALATSRVLQAGRDSADSLSVSVLISRALARTVALAVAQREPSWVLAKGGITSHDVARYGLGAHRAEVAGQLFEGMVSTWLLERDGDRPQLPYVVFPGNVGAERHLALAMDALLDKEG